MTKAKALDVDTVDTDDVRNPIESARAIASALSSIDNEPNTETVIALRAIMEAACRLDAVIEAIPDPDTVEGKPHLVKILKESGSKATYVLYDALNVLEARLGVELGPDEKGNQIGFGESFEKVTAIANEL